MVLAVSATVALGLACRMASAQGTGEPAGPLLLTAEEAAELAVRQSPEIAIADTDVTAAWGRVMQQHADRRPILSSTLYGLSSTIPSMWRSSPSVDPVDMLPIPSDRQVNLNFSAQFPLFTGGRLRGLERARTQDALAEEGARKETELDVRFMALVAYRQVLLGQAVAEIADQTVAALREYFRIAREKEEAGKIARVDLLRQQSALADAEADLVEARGAIRHDENNLRAILAVDQRASVGLVEPLALPQFGGDRNALLAAALSNRPAMAAADARILSAGGTLESIKGQYSPQIYLFGGADLNATDDGPDRGGTTVGLSISLPILDGGRRSGQRREARATIARREEERRQIAIEIDRDLADALVDLDIALEHVELANTNVAAADEAFRVTQIAYDNGKTILAEVYDALAVQVRTHVLRVDAVYRAQVAVDRLGRVLGTDVPGVGEATPYAAGWRQLNISRGQAGEVEIVARELNVMEFLVAVARREALDVDLKTQSALGETVSGVFRAESLEQAVAEALRTLGLTARIADGLLVIEEAGAR